MNFFSENRAVYLIMWKNAAEPESPQMTVWFMCISLSVPKAINTYPEYVILTAFLLQHWLHERALVLRCTYISSPVTHTRLYEAGCSSRSCHVGIVDYVL